MKILTEVEHHKAGDGQEVVEVNMGQPLRLEFKLVPETGRLALFFILSNNRDRCERV